MTKPIVMSQEQWADLFEKIKQREKPSVYLSRSKMKDVLGFTPRNHSDWDSITKQDKQRGNFDKAYTVRLDFYDEAKRTMFLLKYGNGQN